MDLDERIPEAELMDDAAQAAAYAAGDFAAPHQAFVERFAARFPEFAGGGPGRVLDLGCGPADVTVRLARAYPGVRVVAVDGSPAMLALARRRVEAEGLTGRITLEEVRIPDARLGGGRYDAVLSNSLLHHLPDPGDLWDTVRSCAAPGAAVFVTDLVRPPDFAALDRMVTEYTAGEPEVLQRDFRNSLRASYRPEEVVAQLAAAGIVGFTVEQVSDRHLLAWGRATGAPGA